jgi:4-oxalocrotonate tautomerase family enzyme
MPFAQVYAPAGVVSLEQKRDMIKGITEMMVKVEKLPPSALPCVTVLITEVPDGGWGSPAMVMCWRSFLS